MPYPKEPTVLRGFYTVLTLGAFAASLALVIGSIALFINGQAFGGTIAAVFAVLVFVGYRIVRRHAGEDVGR